MHFNQLDHWGRSHVLYLWTHSRSPDVLLLPITLIKTGAAGSPALQISGMSTQRHQFAACSFVLPDIMHTSNRTHIQNVQYKSPLQYLNHSGSPSILIWSHNLIAPDCFLVNSWRVLGDRQISYTKIHKNSLCKLKVYVTVSCHYRYSNFLRKVNK